MYTSNLTEMVEKAKHLNPGNTHMDLDRLWTGKRKSFHLLWTLHFYEHEVAASSVSSRGVTQVPQRHGTFEDMRFHAIPFIFSFAYKLKGP